MALKPRYKRRIFWSIIAIFGIIVALLLLLPTMINLNSMRGRFESAIQKQTGISARVNGDINFGILGRTTLIARNITFANGTIKELSVTIPFWGLFNLENAPIDGDINLYGAKIAISSLVGDTGKYNVSVHDSVIQFMGKDYEIIDGVFNDGTFNGLVRTNQHKYEIKFQGDKFTIQNKNVKLNINGEIYQNGTATGTLSIDTDKINSWFEFSQPRITRRVKLTTDFWWDGEYGFRFSDINADNIHGEITLATNGDKNINLYSDNTSFDFSFLAHPIQVLNATRLNLDFSGDLTFEDKKFNHVKIDVNGTDNAININQIIADNTSITGGRIDQDGAHNIMIKTILDDTETTCMFSGNPKAWDCAKFTFGDFSGTIKKSERGIFYINIESGRNVTQNELHNILEKHNIRNAVIKFKFANIGGKYTITPKKTSAEYDYVYGKNLHWLNPNLKFLPKFMQHESGNMVWTQDTMTFIPTSNTWSITIHNNFFFLTGNSIQKWFSKMDWRPINDFEYTISGYYNERGDISDLTIKMADHVFTGAASNDNITLHTDTFILDTFLNQEYIDRYEEMEFLINAPLLSLFNLDKNIYLSANTLINNGNEYKNFTYALKPNVQNISITDKSRGNLLATIIKEHSNYDIFIQLNKFVINGRLLTRDFPLNITDTSITAEIDLTTNGYIAHDIWYNMRGTLDLTFEGGYLNGIGLDGFYASYNDLTRLNAEDTLARALSDGETKLKSMRVIGNYENGNFVTSEPMKISVRFVDMLGGLKIQDNAMTVKLEMMMRGTSPEPVPVSLKIAPNGGRAYSLSDIMKNLDPAYMRAFINTHDKF